MRYGSAMPQRQLEPATVLPELRVCVRLGRAIAVCEDPPVLELGASEAEVVEAARMRLRSALPDGRGSGFVVNLQDRSGSRRRVETLI